MQSFTNSASFITPLHLDLGVIVGPLVELPELLETTLAEKESVPLSNRADGSSPHI